MNRFIYSALFILTIIIIISTTIPSSPTPDYVGVVEWVIDGDTIIVDSIRIRLLDVNAPELDTSEGVNALYYMINLVYGREVSLFCDGWDKYDRWLCIVWVDGINTSDALISSGHARVWK